MVQPLFAVPKGGLFGEETSSTKRKKVGKGLRDNVWMKYMGNKTQGKCYCCRIRPIHYSDFQVGHNRAKAKGGSDNISNLRPICGTCNRDMGTMSIEQYRKIHYGKPSTKAVKKKPTRRRSGPVNPFGIRWGL